MLQWGRRFSSAEMGDEWGQFAWSGYASMGPPIFIGGNGKKKAIYLHRYEASMGPPIFIGGNLFKQTGEVCYTPSFNGAADFHRRKYGVLFSFSSPSSASMGPPIFIGGNSLKPHRI